MPGPDPELRHPIAGLASVVFLKAVVTDPRIIVGDYSYHHDFDDPGAFERNVRYLFPFSTDRLVIGRFCAIASGVTFLMNAGSHRTDTLSTYPFGIFGAGWEAGLPDAWPDRGDLVVGNDVWIGYGATLLAGVKVGDGAVIGARAVVSRDVPPYAVVAGNPARTVRMRHDERTVARLLALRWWDWPIEAVTEAVQALSRADLDALERLAPR